MTFGDVRCAALLYFIAALLLSYANSATIVPPPHLVGNGAELRVLPIGDSITYGWGSSDGTGYRSGLYDALSRSNEVDFIGSVQNGDMTNNHCECYPGFAIKHILEKTPTSLAERPNLVLLLAGTNDIVFRLHDDKMETVMADLLDQIVQTCPDAAVLVMSLPPLADAEMDKKRVHFNEKLLPELVRMRVEEGNKIMIVQLELSTAQINTTDGVHPTDEAYKIVADTWYRGILEADMKGWIKTPFYSSAATKWLKVHKIKTLLPHVADTQHFSLGALVLFAITFGVYRAVILGRILLKRQ